MTCRSRKCVLCGEVKPWSEFADRGRANKTFACIDCLNSYGKNLESKKPMTVRIDPRKLFEGDNDLRQHLKIELDLDRFFNSIPKHGGLSAEMVRDIENKSMVISLVEEALPKFIEVELYEER